MDKLEITIRFFIEHVSTGWEILKALFVTTLAMTLAGCALPPSVPSSTLSDGVWYGSMTSVSTGQDGSKQEGTSDLLLASCKGVARIWASNGDDNYRKMGNSYVLHSRPDSHLMYFMEQEKPEQPDWVEIQSYAMLEIDSDNAVLQWSRAVNNRILAKPANERYFFAQGTTTLRRISQTCDSRLVP